MNQLNGYSNIDDKRYTTLDLPYRFFRSAGIDPPESIPFTDSKIALYVGQIN